MRGGELRSRGEPGALAELALFDGGEHQFSVPVARTVKPPLTAAALTLVTRTAGSLNAVTVTAPPNGTSGATTIAPPETRTKKSTESGAPRTSTVPRRVSCRRGGDRRDRLQHRQHAAQVGVGHAGGRDERRAVLDQARVTDGQQTNGHPRDVGVQRADVRELIEAPGQSGGVGVKRAEVNRHAVGVVPAASTAGNALTETDWTCP